MLRIPTIDAFLDDGYVLPLRNIVRQLRLDGVSLPSLPHCRPIQLHFLCQDYSCVPLMQQPPYIDMLATFGCMTLNRHTNMAYWTNPMDPFHSVGNLSQNLRPPDSNTSNPLCLRVKISFFSNSHVSIHNFFFLSFLFFFSPYIFVLLQLLIQSLITFDEIVPIFDFIINSLQWFDSHCCAFYTETLNRGENYINTETK